MTRCFRAGFFLIVPLTLSVGSAARACIPLGGTEPPCAAYWKADAVFVGVVFEMSKAPRESNEIFDKLLVRFAVDKAYRGIDGAEVEVSTISGTECDMKIQEGEKWLVYAHRNSTTGRLEVWARTTLYSNADEDLTYFSSLAETNHEASIIGRVFDHPYTPMPGIQIEIRGNGLKYQESTDKEGQFQVAVKPGRYLVRGIFPANAIPLIAGGRLPSRIKESGPSPLVEYQIDIEPGRCEYIEFFAALRNSKSGQH